MPKKRIGEDKLIQVYVCVKCTLGMIVIEDKQGEVQNLTYISRFLKKHPNPELMTLKKFKEVSRKKLLQIKTAFNR